MMNSVICFLSFCLLSSGENFVYLGWFLTDSMFISPTKSINFQNIVEVFATTIMAQWMKVILHYSIDTFTCQIEK